MYEFNFVCLIDKKNDYKNKKTCKKTKKNIFLKRGTIAFSQSDHFYKGNLVNASKAVGQILDINFVFSHKNHQCVNIIQLQININGKTKQTNKKIEKLKN